MQPRSIILPVGYRIKFKFGLKVEEGIINKVMFPGYQLDKFFDDDCLRYGVTDSNDPNHGWLIYENQVVEPDINKAYLDNKLRYEIVSHIKKFINSDKIDGAKNDRSVHRPKEHSNKSSRGMEGSSTNGRYNSKRSKPPTRKYN